MRLSAHTSSLVNSTTRLLPSELQRLHSNAADHSLAVVVELDKQVLAVEARDLSHEAHSSHCQCRIRRSRSLLAQRPCLMARSWSELNGTRFLRFISMNLTCARAAMARATAKRSL